MIDLVCNTRNFRASRRLRARVWQYVVLALSLPGTVWNIPAFSLAIRTVGIQVVDLEDSGEGESESPAEEPVNDAEAFGMIPTCSRLERDLRAGDRCRARLAADVSLREGERCGGEPNARFRRGGSAVQLPLRC
jgi:hypothetical protein